MVNPAGRVFGLNAANILGSSAKTETVDDYLSIGIAESEEIVPLETTEIPATTTSLPNNLATKPTPIPREASSRATHRSKKLVRENINLERKTLIETQTKYIKRNEENTKQCAKTLKQINKLKQEK